MLFDPTADAVQIDARGGNFPLKTFVNGDGKVAAPSEIQIYCDVVFPHRQGLAFYQHKLTRAAVIKAIVSDCKRAKLGSATGPGATCVRFTQRLSEFFGQMSQ